TWIAVARVSSLRGDFEARSMIRPFINRRRYPSPPASSRSDLSGPSSPSPVVIRRSCIPPSRSSAEQVRATGLPPDLFAGEKASDASPPRLRKREGRVGPVGILGRALIPKTRARRGDDRGRRPPGTVTAL
ncbi:hypothetical protein THAOC_21750, partial [Thalassiosira oceanica]